MREFYSKILNYHLFQGMGRTKKTFLVYFIKPLTKFIDGLSLKSKISSLYETPRIKIFLFLIFYIFFNKI